MNPLTSSNSRLAAPRVRLLACALACVALGACGKSSADKTPATQVAVKVNGDEISVHQVNQALSRAGRLPPDQIGAAGKQVLEQLIDQQLLIQKSVEKKLDRDPDVLSVLEASRRQILSQAYLEKTVAASLTKPAPEEVKKFYDAHPDLFAQRRIYRLQELSAGVNAGQIAALRAESAKTRNLNDVANWLRGANIRFSANSAVRAAEQLPLEALPRIAQMKDGDITVTETQGVATVLQVVATQPMPLNEKEAGPFIEQYLANQKRIELASSEMKQLRESAKLEYKGDFVKTAAQAPAAAPAAATPQSAPAAPAASAAKPAQAGEQGGAAAVIDKGVSGLK